MILSRFIEKLKVGKRYALLDLVVQPDCDPPWESAGAENKYIPREVWQMVYRKLQEICQKHFGEQNGSIRKEAVPFTLDKEYEYRLLERPNILVKYEFRGVNQRDVLNIVYNDNEKRLHKECLFVQILDDARNMFRELQEKESSIGRLQKENERLKILNEPSQEYTPAPIKRSSSSGEVSLDNSAEYIPTAINGNSPVQQTSYKPSKIALTYKPKPDPYTPSSSQESDSSKISYIPSSFTTPPKQTDQKSTVSSSAENRIVGKRRRREADIFGHSDDENEDKPSSSTKKGQDSGSNKSVENIFSEELSPKAVDLIATSSDEIALLTDNRRTQLARKSKNQVLYKDSITPEGKSSQAINSKRRKKEGDLKNGGTSKSVKSSSSSLNKSGVLDDWCIKSKDSKSSSSTSKEGEWLTSSKVGSKTKDGDKRKKESKTKKESTSVTTAQLVDREKLREEVETMRKTMANLDKLEKMLPEDKSQLNVPILDCLNLSIEEIGATFEDYRSELRRIFDRYKDHSERQWQKANELCYFTEVTSVMDDDQKYAMMKRLEEEFVPGEDRGKYTEFFSSILIMEWGLRIWMKLYQYADRRMALDRIRLQEEANPMELTSSNIDCLMASNRKKR